MGSGSNATEAANIPGDGARHPLQHKWVLWYDHPKLKSSTETWEENLKHIMAFDTVEDFWSLFNNVMPPSMLSLQSNYSVFKEGIKPMWEDSANRQGGKFVLTLRGEDLGHIDQWWLHAVLAAVGETLEADGEPEVCGLVVSLRKGLHRIGLWTRTCEESRVVPTARRLKEALKLPRDSSGRKHQVVRLVWIDEFRVPEVLDRLPARLKFVFQTHEDAVSSLSSFQNAARFEV